MSTICSPKIDQALVMIALAPAVIVGGITSACVVAASGAGMVSVALALAASVAIGACQGVVLDKMPITADGCVLICLISGVLGLATTVGACSMMARYGISSGIVKALLLATGLCGYSATTILRS